VASPPVVGYLTASLHESPTPSQHSVEGMTSLDVAVGRLLSIDSPIVIPGVTRGQSACSIATSATSFRPWLNTQGIIAATIQAMGFEYLAALKKANLDAIEAKIQEAPMMYKGTERLCGDPTP